MKLASHFSARNEFEILLSLGLKESHFSVPAVVSGYAKRDYLEAMETSSHREYASSMSRVIKITIRCSVLIGVWDTCWISADYVEVCASVHSGFRVPLHLWNNRVSYNFNSRCLMNIEMQYVLIRFSNFAPQLVQRTS